MKNILNLGSRRASQLPYRNREYPYQHARRLKQPQTRHDESGKIITSLHETDTLNVLKLSLILLIVLIVSRWYWYGTFIHLICFHFHFRHTERNVQSTHSRYLFSTRTTHDRLTRSDEKLDIVPGCVLILSWEVITSPWFLPIKCIDDESSNALRRLVQTLLCKTELGRSFHPYGNQVTSYADLKR